MLLSLEEDKTKFLTDQVEESILGLKVSDLYRPPCKFYGCCRTGMSMLIDNDVFLDCFYYEYLQSGMSLRENRTMVLFWLQRLRVQNDH